MRHAHVSVLDQATRTEALVALVDQMVTGVLVPRVAHTFEMADAARAFRRMAQGGLRGRVVLAPDRPV
jgi:NADPH:quinone reductase-like Zn-dependent oxidoreductase